jgi:hypothetical protein
MSASAAGNLLPSWGASWPLRVRRRRKGPPDDPKSGLIRALYKALLFLMVLYAQTVLFIYLHTGWHALIDEPSGLPCPTHWFWNFLYQVLPWAGT